MHLSMCIPVKIKNCLHSLVVMDAIIYKWAIVSTSFYSQHQHLEIILVLILFKFTVVIPLFQAFQMKKLTFEGNPFNQICVYFSFISFLFLGISHGDLTVKFPSALPIHQGISSIYKFVSGLILLTMCTIILSDNLLLSFCISYSPSLIKSHTNNSSSTALSLSLYDTDPLLVQLSSKSLNFLPLLATICYVLPPPFLILFFSIHEKHHILLL